MTKDTQQMTEWEDYMLNSMYRIERLLEQIEALLRETTSKTLEPPTVRLNGIIPPDSTGWHNIGGG